MNKTVKTIAFAAVIAIILAGILMVAIKGFNVGLPYVSNTQIIIDLEKEFEVKDIEQIAEEVIGDEVLVQKVEVYEDIVAITSRSITTEQMEEINNRINEKYELENTAEDIIVKENGKVRISDVGRPYVAPVIIAAVLVLIYTIAVSLVYKFSMLKDVSITKALLSVVGGSVAVEGIYYSVIALTRIPFNALIVPISIIIWLITLIVIYSKFDVIMENKKVNKKLSK